MSINDFCSLEENVTSYFCKAVSFVGPVPSQFEILYLIGALLLIVTVIFFVFALINLFRGRR